MCCKQKTAYDMRMSDWSSDVCSYDLNVCRQKEESPIPCDAAPAARCWTRERPLSPAALPGPVAPARHGGGIVRRTTIPFVPFVVEPPAPYKSVGNPFRTPCDIPRKVFHNVARGYRSEEQTSELQYLMRISYSVFCLKKHTKNKIEG